MHPASGDPQQAPGPSKKQVGTKNQPWRKDPDPWVPTSPKKATLDVWVPEVRLDHKFEKESSPGDDDDGDDNDVEDDDDDDGGDDDDCDDGDDDDDGDDLDHEDDEDDDEIDREVDNDIDCEIDRVRRWFFPSHNLPITRRVVVFVGPSQIKSNHPCPSLRMLF